jgi:hypothetical protein
MGWVKSGPTLLRQVSNRGMHNRKNFLRPCFFNDTLKIDETIQNRNSAVVGRAGSLMSLSGLKHLYPAPDTGLPGTNVTHPYLLAGCA